MAAKYALALDVRNLDALVALFCEDVAVGKNQKGRASLKSWFDETLRHQFSGTSHMTGNQIIEFSDSSHAHGVVYSRNEHETDTEWVVMTMMYWDAYEQINGVWLFRRRLPLYWYASDLRWPPLGENKMRWPNEEPYEGAWAEFWPSWKKFWENPPEGAYDIAEPVDIHSFLQYMRGASDLPSVKVR